jgi:hypothetical protein
MDEKPRPLELSLIDQQKYSHFIRTRSGNWGDIGQRRFANSSGCDETSVPADTMKIFQMKEDASSGDDLCGTLRGQDVFCAGLVKETIQGPQPRFIGELRHICGSLDPEHAATERLVLSEPSPVVAADIHDEVRRGQAISIGDTPAGLRKMGGRVFVVPET